jgi:hypothetical protein
MKPEGSQMTIRFARTKIRRRVEHAANSNDQLNLWVLKLLPLEGMCAQLVTSFESGDVLPSVGIWISERLGEKRQIVQAEQAVRERLATLLVADRSRPEFLNVELLGDVLQLDETAREVLAMAVLCDDHLALDTCLTRLGRLADGNVTRYFQLLAEVIGQPVESVRAALGPESVLRRAGLMTFSLARMRDHENPLECSHLAKTLLAIEHSDARALVLRRRQNSSWSTMRISGSTLPICAPTSAGSSTPNVVVSTSCCTAGPAPEKRNWPEPWPATWP